MPLGLSYLGQKIKAWPVYAIVIHYPCFILAVSMLYPRFTNEGWLVCLVLKIAFINAELAIALRYLIPGTDTLVLMEWF